MKQFIFLAFSIFLLSGCNITVDEADPSKLDEFYKQQAQQTSPYRMPSIEDKYQPPDELFINKYSDLLDVSYTDMKLEDARDISYLALGDSLTRGVGDERLQYGYSERISLALEEWPAILKVNLDNRGKNGRRSDQLLNLLEKGHYNEVLPNADLITMTLGGNDVMKVVKADLFDLKKNDFDEARVEFVERYYKIVQLIREKNSDAPLIMIGFYNPFSIIIDESTAFDEIIEEWNAEIEKIANETPNACYVPVSDLYNTNEDLVYHTDFFHPNAKGYDRMAERIMETMEQCNIEEISDGLIGFGVEKNE